MGGSFAMDIYLPALPDVSVDLATSPAMVQMTLTAFMVSSAVGQLVLGPLSDRWGRWWPLMAGSALFLLAGLGAALADSIWLLIVFRAIQGFGSATGAVIGRAVVADLTSGAAAARLFGILMMLFGFAPVVAPIIGGPLTELGGWRATMWAIVVLSFLMLLSVLLVPESLPREERRVVRITTVVGDFGVLLKNRYFFTCVVMLTAAFAVIVFWLSASSFVLQGHFGLSPSEYSLVFAGNAVGFLIAGFLNTILLRTLTSMQILRISSWIMALGSIGLVFVAVLGESNFWLLFGLVTVAFSMSAPIAANATAVGLEAVPSNQAGGASALMGAAESVIPAPLAPLLGLFGDSPVPMAIGFLISALVCFGAMVVLRRARGNETGGAATAPPASMN